MAAILEHKEAHFFGPPVINQRWVVDEEGGGKKAAALVTERHPTWFDLLFDLVLVANFRTLGELLVEKECTDRYAGDKLFSYLTLSAPILAVWQSLVLYSNRFYTGNLADMLCYLFTITGTLCTAVNLAACDNKVYEQTHSDDAECTGYAWSIVGSRLVLVVMWVRCLAYGICARDAIIYMCKEVVVCTIVAVAGYTATGMLLWVTIVMDVLLVPAIFRYLRANSIPLNVELHIERLGLIVIVALGEIFVNIVKSSMADSWTEKEVVRSTAFIFAGAMTTFLIMVCYFYVFDCPGDLSTTHAMRKTVLRAELFMNLHLPLVLCITLFSGWIEVTAAGSHGDDDTGNADCTRRRLQADDGEDGEFPYTLGNAGEVPNQMAVSGIIFILIIMAVLRRSSVRDDIVPLKTAAWIWAEKRLPKNAAKVVTDHVLIPIVLGVFALIVLLAADDRFDYQTTIRFICCTLLGVTILAGALGSRQHPDGLDSLSDPTMMDMAPGSSTHTRHSLPALASEGVDRRPGLVSMASKRALLRRVFTESNLPNAPDAAAPSVRALSMEARDSIIRLDEGAIALDAVPEAVLSALGRNSSGTEPRTTRASNDTPNPIVSELNNL